MKNFVHASKKLKNSVYTKIDIVHGTVTRNVHIKFEPNRIHKLDAGVLLKV